MLWASPIYAQSAIAPSSVSSPRQQSLDRQIVLRQLSQSRVVYLGETHDSTDDHRAQLEILEALHQQNPKIAIVMEMFQRPYQQRLDQYINLSLLGAISDDKIREVTEFDKRWGFPWEFYLPIIRFAISNNLRIIALNTPIEVTRKVSRQGLDSLTKAERQWIPPFSEIRLEPKRYRDRMRQIYEEIHQGKSNSKAFESFFLAQVLWDETMADAIAQFLKQNPDRQIIVLAGQGHLIYGDGIPNRVARRIPQVQQSIVLLNPPAEFEKSADIADYFWKNRPK